MFSLSAGVASAQQHCYSKYMPKSIRKMHRLAADNDRATIKAAIGSVRGLANTSTAIDVETALSLRDYFDGASKRCLAELGLPADTCLIDPDLTSPAA